MGESKTKVLFLGAESVGYGDSTLGYMLVAWMLEALPRRDDVPSTIVLCNTAVKLVADDSPLLPHLRSLEEKGVNILVGIGCVSELELMERIAVGKLVTMDEIMDVILHNDVVSL